MTNRQAPYRHTADGSPCWTKDCSRGNQASEQASFFQELEANALSLTSIAPLALFDHDIADRYIDVQHHPELPLDVYDYSKSTQFEQHWNPATLAARGLIVDRDTRRIVSRPLGKFFNYSEGKIDPTLMRGPVTVTDKLDGSCGISYPTPDGLAISTRGSFTSEQALHATAVYRERYHGTWQPREGRTYMWEIIYPSNRIVVNYGRLDDIVLIAAVDNVSGQSYAPADVPEWAGPKVESFTYASLTEILAAPPRPNREGLVAFFPQTGIRAKFKQADYVRLHRLMTGVNSRRVWEVIKEGQDVNAFLQDVPEEFESFVLKTKTRLEGNFATEKTRILALAADVDRTFPKGSDQKQLAAYLFARYSRKDANYVFAVRNENYARIDKSIWDDIKPDHEKPFMIDDEG